MNGKTDLELLHAFAKERDDAAFGEIVRRYVDLVHSAALRMVADPHHAEDVSQAAFVALAEQSAGLIPKLRQGMALSAWLHLTTRNLAAKCVRTESRRRAREHAAMAMESLLKDPDQEPSAVWAVMAPHLDDALAELPEPDRHALFLRFFEGKTAREIGDRLGLSEAAAQKRATRALERLRERFALRGVKASSGAISAAIAAHAVSGAPAALAAGITHAALASSVAAAVPVTLGTLGHVTSSLVMTKVQAAVLVAAFATVAIPAGVQQTKLARVRAELAAAPNSTFSELAPTRRPPVRESEAEEMARLRIEIDSLRARAVASVPGVKAGLELAPAGPALLLPGRVVALRELVFAGSETPEAALQSLLASAREGQVEAFFGIALDPPHREEQEMLSTDEGRAELGEALKQFVQEVESVEVIGRREISETRLQLILRESRPSGFKTNAYSFGRTSRGWRRIL